MATTRAADLVAFGCRRIVVAGPTALGGRPARCRQGPARALAFLPIGAPGPALRAARDSGTFGAPAGPFAPPTAPPRLPNVVDGARGRAGPSAAGRWRGDGGVRGGGGRR